MSGCHHEHDADATGKTVAFNLTVNLMLTAAKWLAFALTGSPSIFGEATHSTADSINPILLWIGHRKGRKPPCDEHPQGHGRETFFWSLIAALLMLVGGACLTAWHGVNTLASGQAPEISAVSLGIMAFALLAESVTLTLAWRRLKQEAGHGLFDRLRRSHNSVILAVLMENGVDALGVLLAFTGYGLYALTGNPIWDGLFSLAIAATLAASSLFLVAKNRSLLTGQMAAEHLEPVRQAIYANHPLVHTVVSVAVIVMGPEQYRCRLIIFFRNDWLDAPPSLASDGNDVRVSPPSARELIRELRAIEETVKQTVPQIALVDVKIVD